MGLEGVIEIEATIGQLLVSSQTPGTIFDRYIFSQARANISEVAVY